MAAVNPYFAEMLGQELRKARQSRGLTQEEVAARAGLSREYISIIERGKRSPTIDVLLRVCRAIGVQASAILRKVEGQLAPVAMRK